MKTLQDYMDLAIEKNNLKSDQALNRLMQVSNATASSWRTDRSLPKEPQMKLLAKLAGISPEQALLELSYWNADEETKPIYIKILKRIVGIFLPATLFGSIMVETTTAHASEIEAISNTSLHLPMILGIGFIAIKVCHNMEDNVYYGK